MLIKKLLLLLFILLFLAAITRMMVLHSSFPAFYGNLNILNKINYINSDTSYNLAFIGDSKTENQINPVIFDSNTQHKTKSFNLGCSGMDIQESYVVYDKVLNMPHIKYIVYEIRSVHHIKTNNLHITRTIYFQNFQTYFSTIANCFSGNIPLLNKIAIVSTHTISFIEYLFNFVLIQGLMNFETNQSDQTRKIKYETTKGFDAPDTINWEILKSHPEILTERMEIAKKSIHEYYHNTTVKYNKYYTQTLQNFADRAKEKNIKLIYMLPSSLYMDEYAEMLPVIQHLKNVNIMMMSDGGQFPKLYEVKNNLEPDHVNRYGSVIFSQYLAQEFNRLTTN